jgi:hypothetical protein
LFIKCTKKEEISCTGKGYEVLSNNVVRLITEYPSTLLMTHSPNECTICTGLSYQVLVWGDRKHTLWYMGAGENYCIVLGDCFLDFCSSELYVVSNSPHACRELELSNCERDLYDLLKSHYGKPLFVCIDHKECLQQLIHNVVYHGLEDDCLGKLNKIKREIIHE